VPSTMFRTFKKAKTTPNVSEIHVSRIMEQPLRSIINHLNDIILITFNVKQSFYKIKHNALLSTKQFSIFIDLTGKNG
jgi:hypothetical protein